MRIGIAEDHAGVALKERLISRYHRLTRSGEYSAAWERA